MARKSKTRNRKSKKQKPKTPIYQIAKFVILSFIIIYFLYFKAHMPLSLVLILELLLFIKVLPVTEFVDEKLVKYYPKYKKFNIWKKRAILFAFFVFIFVILKFIIINIMIIKILNIPIEEQIYEFINKYLEEGGVK
ncbi:MAG: hypothetical protein KAV25_00085 [Methanophagales archaeon]|nr:hypothetical protein [Methanophagales archaeon]